MVNSPTGGVFGHRNARSKSSIEVAKGFVPPPQYWEIAQPGNTLLIGPRGSGKTTILRMLQGVGLEHWDGEDAAVARDLVNYSGVFVPADQSWSGQVEAFGRELDDNQVRADLGRACFTLHTLRALAHCAKSRVEPAEAPRSHDRVELGRNQQERIVRETWGTWALPEPVSSFAGLSEALSTTLAEIGRLARRGIRHPEAHKELSFHPAFDLEVVDAVVPFIERFNNAVGQEDHVWSFLIDEIEFLPPGIHRSILSAMRGRDTRINRKLSLAPYTLLDETLVNNPLGGWEGHDFVPVDLTFPEKEDGYKFSRALIEKELEALPMDLDSESLLGEGGFFENPPGRDAYEPGSENAEAIAELAVKDATFHEWLDDHQVDPSHPEKTVGDDRAATLRKAIPIIRLRDEYRHLVGGKWQPRTRKAAQTYVGELSAYAICENNPRLLQTLVSRLLAAHHEGSLDDSARVEVIQKISEQFKLHLRAVEVAKSAPDELLPMRLVDKIGTFFEKGVLDDPFDPEPALSFECTHDPKQDVVLDQVLSQLVFYGAVIPSGKRKFRLAHTFAPLHKLPLRKGRPRALTSIIGAIQKQPKDQLQISEEQL
jgi:energy-coupling factor transporter ATP-binding protein EcfA2